MPRGLTTLELVVTLAILAVITAISIPKIRGVSDRIAVSQATNEASLFIQQSRLSAVMLSGNIRLLFGSKQHLAIKESNVPGELDRVILSIPGPSTRGVVMSISRAEIRFQPNGLGWGAANTKLIFRRGGVSDSLTTSVLGRVRRYP